MSNTEQVYNVLEDTAELLRKTQVNLKKCPKQRLTKGYVQTRIECIEEYWSTFKKAHQELIRLTSREQRANLSYFANDEYFLLEDIYLSMSGDLKDMLAAHSAMSAGPSRTPDDSVESQAYTQVKLPRIQLPTFSGNYEEWPAFNDLYVSLIHDNPSLTNVQKLYYLKSSIVGEAAALLKHIQITDPSYQQAWDTLKQRYGNKRLIVNSLLKRFFSQKKCSAQTATQLKGLFDTTNEVMNSLQNLKVPTDSWDPIIIFLVVQKLDPDSHKEWEHFSYSQKEEELPSWNDLKKFLESKFRTLELVTPSSSLVKDRIGREKVFHVSMFEKCCIMCKESHALYRCKEFTKMQPSERSQYAQDNKLCYNCLSPGHSAFKCHSHMSCHICRRRHHSLLHQSKSDIVDESALPLEPMQPTSSLHADVEESLALTAMASTQEVERKICLLGTAVVKIVGENGHTTVVKALIDSGSQACFISEKATQALKLERKAVNLIVTGMESMEVQVKQKVKVQVLSQWEDDFEIPIEAYVMSKHLKVNIPSQAHPVNEWPHLKEINLADPNFLESGTLDLLLGVEEYTKILQQGLIKGPSGTPCAQRTNLGWIVMGGTNLKIKTRNKSLVAISNVEPNIEDLLKTIWEIDTDTKRMLTKEEQRCENIYEKTHSRNKEGRYIIRLPFKTEKPQCIEGNTRDTAIKRFMQLENKFRRNLQLKEEYKKVIEDYKDLKHLEEIPSNEIENKSVYLPHHAVIRQDKETTRTRVVFDASSKGSNGVALNDELLAGPVLQEDLRNLIMRWRMHAICFVSDIEKMYRMILVSPEDANYQRIVWRNNPSEEIKDYRLLTVTFGTTSAPYLAVKTLKQLAVDEGNNFPEAARILNEDFFIDDCMSGSDDVSGAIQVSKDLKELLRRGGFKLKKWASNNSEFMQALEPNERSTKVNLQLKLDGVIKALGIQWNLGKDRLEYKLTLPVISNKITKRSILSDIQKLFDPLGWISPCIVLAKILIQKLWLERVNWDQDLEYKLAEEWKTIRSDLEYVDEIYIERWLGVSTSNKKTIQLHGFCDASMQAYAAVLYCRVQNLDGSCKICLVAARTRVAPLKTISLPRLELCGALLLSKLLRQVSKAMRISNSQIFAWTDSSIVLSWLFGEPSRWKPFIANRVVEITSNVNCSQWYHVQSEDNPADIASRGLRQRTSGDAIVAPSFP
ncbi:hypothetical protein K1T71_014936 [Dendrolimus kikuchii]|nr:hypothetical protein K1T71_014936 [Dendrolimus kikuchii]